ncbi:MAG: hypothetical protein KatS3mg032_0631 [Cyclobacteriaceae bacterium]|nr:MAG: hypothetical protein KatS3mg032_0631 [Cyclobacteriaceae bacterium]
MAQCVGLPAILSLGSTKNPNRLCSPVTADLSYNVRFASPVPAGSLIDLVFNWNDGSGTAIQVVPLTPGSDTYSVTRTRALSG